MNVEVLYFAGAREIAGKSCEHLQLPPQVVTVSQFLDWLVECYPELEPYAPSLRIARNESFADGQDSLRENDVLAIIPPVAGG